jgi:hypothetical protein
VNTIEHDMLQEERLESLRRIDFIVQQYFGRSLTEQERQLFMARGTFCPSAATMVRKRDDGKKPKEKKSWKN